MFWVHETLWVQMVAGGFRRDFSTPFYVVLHVVYYGLLVILLDLTGR